MNSGVLFKLEYPEYKLEAVIGDGQVFVRRNGIHQHSDRYDGMEPCRVAIQWDMDSISCGIMPISGTAELMDTHMRAARTPIVIPPLELLRLLRTENLLTNAAYKNIDDLFSTVLDCLRLCEADIRRHGAERFVWEKAGSSRKPIDEPEISRLVASFLTSHGASKNFDVSCEPIAGGGNVDMYVVAPIQGGPLARIAIEAKKAESAKLVHGFSVQLPEYMARIGTTRGIYLTYWLKSPAYPYPHQKDYAHLEIEVLHPLPRPPGIRTVGLNLSYGPPPSKIDS